MPSGYFYTSLLRVSIFLPINLLVIYIYFIFLLDVFFKSLSQNIPDTLQQS